MGKTTFLNIALCQKFWTERLVNADGGKSDKSHRCVREPDHPGRHRCWCRTTTP